MPFKIKFRSQEYILGDDVITAIVDQTKSSEEDNKERSFPLCTRDSKHIEYNGKTCIGSECRVDVQKECMTGYEYVGEFHVHPDGKSLTSDSTPSSGDLLGIIYDALSSSEHKKFSCRTGAIFMECQRVKPESAIGELGKVYRMENELHHSIVNRFYDEWERTKSCPVGAAADNAADEADKQRIRLMKHMDTYQVKLSLLKKSIGKR